MALKKSKRKDYYKILGVNKNASTDEIKKAYRKRALVHHPGQFVMYSCITYHSIVFISQLVGEYVEISWT